MKIGKLMLDADGRVTEVVEETTFDSFEEAKEAAEVLKSDNANNQQVVDVFIANEISPNNYRISVVL